MNNKIRVSLVSYLNTYPFLYGLKHNSIIDQIDLSLDIPFDCAKKLINGEADLGLIPIAVLPGIKHADIVSNHCIASDGAVETVCLFSEYPIEELDEVYLDYQSRTSVVLIKILMKHYWKKDVRFLKGNEGYEQNIKKTTGGLIIGDRVIQWRNKFNYKYDLGEAWKKLTGLPFVFAVWVSNNILPDDFLQQFSKALEFGLINMDAVIKDIKPKYPDDFDIKDYFYNKICYRMDAKKREAMELFSKYSKEELPITLV